MDSTSSTLTLSCENFPATSSEERLQLDEKLQAILQSDFNGNLYALLARYQRILADNMERQQWPAIHDKLQTLFMCGQATPLDGPMVGIPVSIRDSDYFRKAAELFGKERSLLAKIELMATAWNASFADTGLWMGKTFEPVSEEVVKTKSANDPEVMAAYNPDITRIGRNFFRDPGDPNLVQSLGLPVLKEVWHLIERPMSVDAQGFEGTLLAENLAKERNIPYSMTGGIYLADMGNSVVPEMNGKAVYQLNYRWPVLKPAFPMTCLIDEIVQLGEGIYLGQLVFATKHYSLGSIDLPFIPGDRDIELGVPYAPNKHSLFESIRSLLTGHSRKHVIDYGYQNNGFFLMMDPAYAKSIYADNAFPQLRPRRGEIGYQELGYSEASVSQVPPEQLHWQNNAQLKEKFTTLITEDSTRSDDGDVRELLRDGETVLQMLKRLSVDISAQTKHKDHLSHFEPLHQLFRCGVAPKIKEGLFQGRGTKGFNTRLTGRNNYDWYGEEEKTQGFDYYHGATLNLHWGFSETFCPDRHGEEKPAALLPSALATAFSSKHLRGPNVMNMVWHSIGKYIFPWAGKSFEKITPRKLSMLLDESPDLNARYPQRVAELKRHLSSAPHYALVKNNNDNYWDTPGRYASHLSSGAWDQGMSDEDKQFWMTEASERWVMGYNLQDKRIRVADALMRIADMNYRIPEPVLQQASEESGSPFVRQGYAFLGAADQQSILSLNNGDRGDKRVFQFNYRFPLIGGPVPIGYCLDELVEIADGLFLGQLIYSTALDIPFHSSVEAEKYKYQLFGYFLLLDDDWERHRQEIKLDTLD